MIFAELVLWYTCGTIGATSPFVMKVMNGSAGMNRSPLDRPSVPASTRTFRDNSNGFQATSTRSLPLRYVTTKPESRGSSSMTRTEVRDRPASLSRKAKCFFTATKKPPSSVRVATTRCPKTSPHFGHRSQGASPLPGGVYAIPRHGALPGAVANDARAHCPSAPARDTPAAGLPASSRCCADPRRNATPVSPLFRHLSPKPASILLESLCPCCRTPRDVLGRLYTADSNPGAAS